MRGTVRVFISGVAGFLGSHLADAFLARGDTVVGCDNLIGGYRDNVPKGVLFAEVDCNELRSVRSLMAASDVAYHLAATPHEGLSVFSPHENARHGIGASAAMFSAAIETGVKRFVFASSMARYGTQETLPFTEDMTPRPQDPYGIGKWASELMLKNLCDTHGMEYVVAVPHSIIGPRQKYDDPFRNVVSIFINMMLQGRQPFIYGDGGQERCFSYVTDCVEPLVRMATATNVVGETINIGPDEEVVTVLQLASIIAKAIDFRLDPVFIDDRPCEVKLAHCSADKSRQLLGYEPRVGLDWAIGQMIGWIRERGPKPFTYHLATEINNDKLPETWGKRLF